MDGGKGRLTSCDMFSFSLYGSVKLFFGLVTSLEWSPSHYQSAEKWGGKKNKLQRNENKPLIIQSKGSGWKKCCSEVLKRQESFSGIPWSFVVSPNLCLTNLWSCMLISVPARTIDTYPDCYSTAPRSARQTIGHLQTPWVFSFQPKQVRSFA